MIWAALLLALSAQAAPLDKVPHALAFQAFLTDSADHALNGTYTMRFKILTAGTPVWCAEYAVPVTNGIASVSLGEAAAGGTAFNSVSGTCTAGGTLPISPDLLSGISAGTAVELQLGIYNGASLETISPNFGMTAVPFALVADSIDGFDSTQLVKLDGSQQVLSANGVPVIGPSGDWIGPPVAVTGGGPTGTRGATGSTGASGSSGATGQTGSFGGTGSQGFVGDPGFTGVTGASGKTGASGESGATGATGGTGANGLPGAVGQTGAGSTGETGFSGATGASGVNGATGQTGAAGSSGASGASGSSGASGASGVSGLTGATGANGLTGASGASGASGATGFTGASGASGATGATGASPWLLSGNNTYYTAGRVGIGSASPQGALDVSGDDGDTVLDLFLNHSGLSNGGIKLHFQAQTVDRASILATNGNGPSLNFSAIDHQFNVSQNERAFKLISGGNGANTVIIGPSDSSTWSTLQVKAFSGATAVPLMHIEHEASPTTDYLQIASNGSTSGNILTVNSTGYLGIGTTGPVAALNSYVSNTATPAFSVYDGFYSFNLGWGAKTLGGNYLSLFRSSSNTYINHSSGDFIFQSGAAERMRIKDGGNVGIGTVAPTGQLHVVAGVAGVTGVIIQGAASQTADLLQFQDSGGAALSRIRFDGTFTSPDGSGIQVGNFGGLSLRGSSGGYFYVAPASDGVAIQTNGRITTGTTVPSLLFTNNAFSAANSFSATSGTQTLVRVAGDVHQGGSAGYTALDIAMTESSAGTGQSYLLRAQKGGGNRLAVGTDGAVAITLGAVGATGLTIQGAASHTGNLTEWQNSSGTVLARVDAAGKFYGDGSGLTAVSGATDSTKVLKAGDTMTGPLRFADGSAAAPSMTFSSLPNTGFYVSGGTVARLAVGGNDLAQIGTTYLQLRHDARIQWGSSGIANDDVGLARKAAGVMEISDPSGNPRDLQVRAINPASGNLGIGTTSPDAKLHVLNGNVELTSTNSPYTSGVFSTNTIYLADNQYLDNASGTYKATSTGLSNRIEMKYDEGIKFVNSPMASAGAAVTSSEVMRINTSGNIGIGTTSPLSKLNLDLGTDTPGILIRPFATQTQDTFSVGNVARNGYTIQMTPAGSLKVYDGSNNSRAININSVNARIEGTNVGATYWTLGYGAADHLAIKNDGKIGIGTVDPVAALDVVGQIYSRANIIAATPTTVDFNLGNTQVLATDPTSITLQNMQEGGTYTLICTSGTAGQFNFSASGVTTFYYKPANASTSSGTRTIYTFVRANNLVYVSWNTGFQ